MDDRRQRAVAAQPAADRAHARPSVVQWCGRALDALATRPQSARLRALIEAARQHAEELIERADRLAGLADDLRRGDRVRLPVRRRAPAVLDRLQRRPTAGSTTRTTTSLASEARLASFVAIATRQDLARALVQARTLADAERHVARAALVERVDVRVPDAAAGDAVAPRHAARRDLRRGRAPADRLCGAAAACRGASPSRPTTRRISRATISTGPSACPASA